MITCLGEPQAYTFEWQGKTKPKIKMWATITRIGEKTGEDKYYTAYVSEGKDTHYGQIVRLGHAWGTLVGKPFNVFVTGEGKNSRYVIVETAALDNKKEN